MAVVFIMLTFKTQHVVTIAEYVHAVGRKCWHAVNGTIGNTDVVFKLPRIANINTFNNY